VPRNTRFPCADFFLLMLASLEAEIAAQGHTDPQGSAEPRPNGGATAESPWADEHVPAATTAAEATAPVATPAHITKRNENGKRNRFPTDPEKNGEVGHTPRGVTTQENGDSSPKFRLPRPEVNPNKRDGLPPGEQRLRAACNGDNLAVADYMMSEMRFFFEEKMTKVLARLTETEKQLETVLDAQIDTLRELSSVKSMLDAHGIQQNRIAATVASGTQHNAPQPSQRDKRRIEEEEEKRREEARKREEKKRREAEKRKGKGKEGAPQEKETVEETVGQKRMEAEKEKAPEERRREKGKETAVETEEMEETAEGEMTTAGGSKRSKKSTWADRADATTEQERASVAQLQRRPRPRPRRLVPVDKYPRAEREVLVTFDELKNPEGVNDRHLADLALRAVNCAILNHQDVKQFPFHLARVTGSRNIALTAAGNVRGVVYSDYVNIIAEALKDYGTCTAKVHEKWSKFLVRGVPAWTEMEGIREDIEWKYPGIRLAQSPGLFVPSARREGVAEATVIIALLGQVPLSRLGKRIAIGSQYCTVEQYYEYTDYTQCTRCQKYGHVAERCKSPHPRCAVCAENHVTKDHPCQESGCRRGPACMHKIKCENCSAPHKARDRLCPHRHNAYRAYHKHRGFSDAEATTGAAQFVEFDQ
jgi:hypothetical protein